MLPLLIIVGAIIAIFVLLYNGIIGSKNTAEESYSAIDTVLQNRYDLIPNLVEVVKQYASHETAVFQNVSEMRAKLMQGQTSTEERFANENTLFTGMKSLFAIAENYPELKASTNFLDLQNQWGEMEDRLQGARRAYNAAVKDFKNKKEMFPTNYIASMMTLPDFAMYEADEAAKDFRPSAKEMFAK